MAQRTEMIKAAKIIRKAIEGFVSLDEQSNIDVFESSAGHLRVIVGSDLFKDKGPVERQNIIWDYLKKKVAREQLLHCSGVDPRDVQEYEEASFPQSAEGSSSFFISGSEIVIDDDEDDE